MSVMSVGKPSARAQSLLDTSEFIQERDPMSAMNVEKLSSRARSWSPIRGYTAERNPMNVGSVEKPSVWTQTSSDIREFTVEKNPTSVMTVARPSKGAQPLFSTRESILGMKLIYVMNVGRLLGTDQCWCAIRESTLLSNLIQWFINSIFFSILAKTLTLEQDSTKVVFKKQSLVSLTCYVQHFPMLLRIFFETSCDWPEQDKGPFLWALLLTLAILRKIKKSNVILRPHLLWERHGKRLHPVCYYIWLSVPDNMDGMRGCLRNSKVVYSAVANQQEKWANNFIDDLLIPRQAQNKLSLRRKRHKLV